MATPTQVRFRVLGALCVASALAYLMRNSLGAAESTVRGELGLSKDQSGLLMSAFFWPYALFQIPAAAFAQRVGFVRALSLFAVVWSGACAAFAFGEYRTMVGARVLMGVAQAGLVPAGIGMLAGWFPRSMQGASSGAFAAAMSVGSIIAAPLTAWMSTGQGWRGMFVWYAVPGVVWAGWFLRRGRDRPALHAGVNADELALIGSASGSVRTSERSGWRGAIVSVPVLLLCLQQVCRAAGYIFFASWFTTYLQEARGLTVVRSGVLTMLPLMGDVGGSFFGGVISDTVLRWSGSVRVARQVVSAVAMTCCAVLVGGSRWVESSESAVVLISAGMFCAAVGNPCANAVAMRIGGQHVATLSALNNMCGNVGAAAFPLVVPVLLRSAAGWDAVLNVFVGLYLVASAAWLLMRDVKNPPVEVTSEEPNRCG